MGLSRKVEDLERFQEVVQILFREELGYVLDRLDLGDKLPAGKRLIAKRHRKPNPVRLRETIEQLGPVYIKFGQMLAEREDLISKEYADELKKLESEVPPFDSEKAKNIVARDVGMENFSRWDEEPIASASIAQVHRAKLNSGEEVAVKVRRPGIAEQVDQDTDILYYFARRLEKLSDVGNRQLSKDVEAFREWTKREIDLRNEASNGKQLKEVFSDFEKVKLPEIYDKYTTERVLITEYKDAVKLDNVEKLEEMGVDIRDVLDKGIKAHMTAIFKYGFFHADPHPSNFLVDEDGSIIMLDFGIVGRFSRKNRKNAFVMMYSISRGDPKGVYDTLLDMSTVEDEADLEGFESLVENQVLQMQGRNISEKSISTTFAKISMRAMNYGVYIPNDIIVMGKGMATMEGVAMRIYPDYNFAENNKEFLREMMRDQFDPEESAKELGIDFLKNREFFEQMPSKINELMEKQDRKVVVKNETSTDNVVPGILIASSIFLALSVPSRYGIAAGAAGLGLAYYLHVR